MVKYTGPPTSACGFVLGSTCFAYMGRPHTTSEDVRKTELAMRWRRAEGRSPRRSPANSTMLSRLSSTVESAPC